MEDGKQVRLGEMEEKTRWPVGMAQEHLLSKHEALSSNFSVTKKGNNRKSDQLILQC
jgi:hypothetical protein